MQIFELHFNPPRLQPEEKLRVKPELIFDSFCYTPENVYEKRLGSLYLVGVLKNALPQNYHFLNKLAKIIKEKFYSLPLRSTEENFKACLKEANQFLEKEIKTDNTNWLGNLSFAAISLKNFQLNFTKVGDLKIVLLRGGEVIEMSKKLDGKEIEPYPLKIFLNIVAGKLISGDIVLVLDKNIFNYFFKEHLLKEISQISAEGNSFGKKFKKFLKSKEKIFLELSGICLLISLEPEVLPKQILSFKKKIPTFNISKFLKSFVTLFKKPISLPPHKITLLENLPKIALSKELKKKLILILALIFLLLLGFLIF